MKKIGIVFVLLVAASSIVLLYQWRSKEMFFVDSSSTFRDGQAIQADLEDGTVQFLRIRRVVNVCWYEAAR